MEKKKPCLKFNIGNCPNGEECQYEHRKIKKRICKYYNTPQGCPFKINCGFKHVLEENIKKENDTIEEKPLKKKKKENTHTCPVCINEFESWESLKEHFQKTAHLGIFIKP
jgi:2-succinyl-5-enolpyruvyl-6-hydroxy-3-cyclohexene-1-carboxylate synthase